MNFVSALFVMFLLGLLLLFTVFPARWRMGLLLAASYVFYASWSAPFLLIILFTTSTDYWISNLIHRSPSAITRKIALASGLTLNLLILFFFKYFNFFLDNGNNLFHLLGQPFPFAHVLPILLPLGISFYTFEAISYMVDVYRGHKPAKNWLEYNFYIMYFPHLISGPIVRFSELVHQYRLPIQLPSLVRIAQGVELIVLGYLFKVLIADNACLLVNPVFEAPETASVLATYMAALGFTVQIYFDFMGYTHIARGVSLLFNIEMPLNFNFPYLAHNISDFWKRWHISLSRWIRDYLYISLGGSRGALMQTLLILMVTMTLCGAWHGAGWTYIVWGAYHGVLLGVYHLYTLLQKTLCSPSLRQTLETTKAYRIASILLTFVVVVVGWVLFRAPNLTTASQLLHQLFNVPAFLSDLTGLILHAKWLTLGPLLLLLLCCFLGPKIAGAIRALYQPQPFVIKTALASALVLLCWVLTAKHIAPFIYFQF